jgi:hypothetical protein
VKSRSVTLSLESLGHWRATITATNRNVGRTAGRIDSDNSEENVQFQSVEERNNGWKKSIQIGDKLGTKDRLGDSSLL